MKQALFLFIALFTQQVFAQPQCGFDLKHNQLLLSDPDYAQRVQEFNNKMALMLSQTNGLITTSPSNTVYEIPVVVHVIHTGGSVGSIYNPTDSAIISWIDYLNKAYAATYVGYADTTSGGVYFPVKFVLAKRNESCSYTTGINRADGSGVSGYVAGGVFYASTGVAETSIKALSRWRNTDYYNIWIVNKIDGADGTSGSFTAGYAYFPGAGPTIDGTVILATQIAAGKSTIVHELGHAFNLYHTFEGDGTGSTCPIDTNCLVNGDMVCDTKPHKRSVGCPLASDTNHCAVPKVVFGTLPKNFMDYSSCKDRFTAGQYTRWMTALLTSRPGLASSMAGKDTGTNVTAASCTTKIYTANASNTFNMGPVKVELNDLTANSKGYNLDGFINYIDRSCQQRANLIAGQSYALNVTTETNPQQVKVFIDYNNNGSFSSGELVYSTVGSISGTEVHDTTYIVPTSGVTTCTPLRMRVLADWRFAAAIPATGCDSLAYGQAEDFAVVIKPASDTLTLTSAITSGGNPSCSGSSLTFTVTPSKSITSPTYYWYVNGALASSGSTTFTSSSIANAASVRAKVIYTASCGTDSAFSNIVTVIRTTSLVPDVTIVASPGTSICSGTSVTFTATPTNGGSSPAYQWKVNNVNVGTNSSTYASSSLANGDVVKCVLTSSASCAIPATDTSNSVTITVTTTVTPGVTIAASPGNTICAGTSVTFTATPTNGGSTPSYQWKLNGVNVGTNSTTYTNSSLANNDTIRVVMTGSATCTTASTATSNNILMTVNPNLTPAVSIAASPGNSICAGTSVIFSATPTNGGSTPSYQWKRNGVNVGTNSSTYSNSGLVNNDTIRVVMTGSATCTTAATATSNNILMAVTTNVTPSVTIATSPGNTICAGTSVTFTATPTNGGTPSYQWKLNGVNVGTNSSTYTNSSLANNDTVRVVMTSTVTCVTASTATSNNILMAVTSSVTPSVSISATATSICFGTSVTFTATPTNGGTPSYQWKLNGVNVGTNSNTYTNSLLLNNDTVRVVMTSSLTCASPTTATSNNIIMSVGSVTPSVSIAASPGSTICSGASVTFTATPVNGGSTPSYQWKRNGVNVGTNSSTFTSSGLVNNDTIRVVMTSSLICATPASVTSNNILMTVNPNLTPSVVIAASPGNTICAGASVIFSATPTNGGSTPSYQWKLNGVNVGTNSSTYTNSSLANNDTVRVVMTSNATCLATPTGTSNNIIMIVTPNVTPSVTISANPGTSVCTGVSVTFTATPTNGGSSPSYQWKRNSVNVGTNSSTFTSSSLSNNDTISVVVTSSLACVTASTATSNKLVMTISGAGTPGVFITASPGNNICAGTSVTFTATPINGGSAPAYQWKLNGINVGTNSNTYSNVTLVTGDVVSCVMTSNATCLSTQTATSNNITMTVGSAVIPGVVVSVNPNDTICGGTLTVFTAAATNGGSTPTYQWKLNGTNVGTNSSTYINSSLANGDMISCVLTTSATCVTSTTANSNSIMMFVQPSISATVTVTAAPGTSITYGDTVVFTSTTNVPSPIYQWRKNGVDIVGETASTYTTSTLRNDDIITLFVQTTVECVTPDTLSSGGTTMVVGINDVNTAFGSLRLVPNPNNGSFRIMADVKAAMNGKTAAIEVLNALGAVVYKEQLKVNGQKLDKDISIGEEHADGLYLLRINIDGNAETLRFVVSR